MVIPARFASTRLPGKPLLSIGGRPLVQWVWQSAVASGARSVCIATDDERIRDISKGFGAECVMTSPDHNSGTDRIAEVARARGYGAEEVVVNLQGDEPLMPGEVIARVAHAAGDQPRCDLATAIAPILSAAEFLDPNCVKALPSRTDQALYFSRAPVPWPREDMAAGLQPGFRHAWRHIGIYAYRVRSLLDFAQLAPTAFEEIEKLEQLRALEHGMSIRLVRLAQAPPAGIDTPQDLERVRLALGGA